MKEWKNERKEKEMKGKLKLRGENERKKNEEDTKWEKVKRKNKWNGKER